jgi:two-component system, cell cycle response regulator
MDNVTEDSAFKLVENYEKKIFDLKQLIEISKGLNSTLEYNTLIDSILLTCMGHMQLIRAGIFLFKELDGKSFVLHRNYKGFDLSHNVEYLIDAKSMLIRFLEEKSKCYTLKEIQERFDGDPEIKVLAQIDPMLIVPLKGKGRLNGIIVLGERISQLPFSEAEKDYLMNIASLAGIAISNAHLYELATTDMMTRLKIHHFFQNSLLDEFERTKAINGRLSMMMIDIDNFKRFNDTYGHQCGDVVLKNVAQIIKENSRQIDIAARYGGEEMAVILTNTDIVAAEIVAERVRKNIESSKVSHDGNELSVTVSIGVAQFDVLRDKETRHLIERADKAMYKSKQSGRNRVSLAD